MGSLAISLETDHKNFPIAKYVNFECQNKNKMPDTNKFNSLLAANFYGLTVLNSLLILWREKVCKGSHCFVIKKLFQRLENFSSGNAFLNLTVEQVHLKLMTLSTLFLLFFGWWNFQLDFVTLWIDVIRVTEEVIMVDAMFSLLCSIWKMLKTAKIYILV